MGVKITFKLPTDKGVQLIVQAGETYRSRLRTAIDRTRRPLSQFEKRYEVDTAYFLEHMTAEDLKGGDLEYAEWAGEARLLKGLEQELTELEKAQYVLS